MATKTETPWAELKRKQRKRPETRAYERARGLALNEVSRLHQDEYQDILKKERTRILRELRAKERAAAKKPKAS